MSTAHANSCEELVARLETMALMSDVDLPAAHVREQIAATVDLVVQMARLRDGRRVVSHVASVEGQRDGRVILNDVFASRRERGWLGRTRGVGQQGREVQAILHGNGS
jgi:pilus assembly protein CpaF